MCRAVCVSFISLFLSLSPFLSLRLVPPLLFSLPVIFRLDVILFFCVLVFFLFFLSLSPLFSETWTSLKKIRTQESYVKKQRLKMLMHKENVAQAIEHIMTSLADLTLVDRDPKIISKTAKVLYDQENYDPDVTDEKTNDEVNDLTKPDRMF